MISGAIKPSHKPLPWPPSDLKNSHSKVPTPKTFEIQSSISWRASRRDQSLSSLYKTTKHQVRAIFSRLFFKKMLQLIFRQFCSVDQKVCLLSFVKRDKHKKSVSNFQYDFFPHLFPMSTIKGQLENDSHVVQRPMTNSLKGGKKKKEKTKNLAVDESAKITAFKKCQYVFSLHK